MKEEELLSLVEDKNTELKKATNGIPNYFWETYSAFANTDGGLVVFGVDEKNHKITGVNNAEKLKQDLLNNLNNPNKVSRNILSNDSIKIEHFENGSSVILIQIPEALYSQKPIYLDGNPKKAYERLGEGDIKLTEEKYKALIVGSQEITDDELLKNYDLSDLNEETLIRYKKSLFEQTKNEKYKNLTYKEMLLEIGAFKKDRQGDGEYYLTTDGLLLFGRIKSINDRFPGFRLDYFEKSSSYDIDWQDRVSSEDGDGLNIFDFYYLVLDKLRVTAKDKFKLSDTQKRLPFKEDLMISLREALVNSLMHAYYDADFPIKVIAYDDYYEFENPGKMRISVEEFIYGGNSKIRNHTISSIMRRIGISEKAGSGGPRMFDIASKNRLKYPEIYRKQDRTIIRIWKVDLEETFKTYPSTQKKILKFIFDYHAINRKEAYEKLQISNYDFRVAIDGLLQKNIIETEGKGRATKYILKKSSLEHSYSLKRHLKKIEDLIKE